MVLVVFIGWFIGLSWVVFVVSVVGVVEEFVVCICKLMLG